MKFFSKVKDIFSIEDLKVRIFNTVKFLVIFRIGSYIVLPGVDPSKLVKETSGIFGILNTFLGGAFSNASVFGLGVMPYISSSIAVQLLTIVLPYFQRLQKDGHSGKKQLNMITKVLTIFMAMVQSIGYVSATIPDDSLLIGRIFFTLSSIIVITAGTMSCMWLGDRINDKGIGNGISMLIMIGIVSSLPGALIAEFISRGSRGILIVMIELIALFFIVVAIVMFTQATRKIPIQYDKQIVSNVYSGQRQYIPLKLNATGVMPIIFSQTIMFIPVLISGMWVDKSSVAAYIRKNLTDITTWQYNLTFAVLIILFTFFYTAITINPVQMADDMKRNNGFIPGVKPGKSTADYIDDLLSNLTLPGSIFLAIIAILPGFAHLFGVSHSFCKFYGGTSLLILVGVVLDILQQVEGFLLMHRYSGLSDYGRIQGRYQNTFS